MEDAVFQYGPDDITEEEVTLEWETRPLGELPICPHGHSPMTKQQATYTMAGGKFTVTYSVYVCPECKETFLDREQARRYGALQVLDRLLQERGLALASDGCSMVRTSLCASPWPGRWLPSGDRLLLKSRSSRYCSEERRRRLPSVCR